MNTLSYDSREEGRVRYFFAELIQARELLVDMVWKDLRVMYRYAVLGFLWAVIEPIAFAAILTFVFSFVFAQRGAPGPIADGAPFALMLLCGLVFWQHFSTSVTAATTSMVTNRNLVKKVRFTREIIPLASCCMPLVQLAIGFLILLVVHHLFGERVNATLLFVPLVFATQFLLTAGVALFLACMHVFFRDIGNLISVLITFAFYASPVFYPVEMVRNAPLPPWVVHVYMANPMVGLLSSYRQILFEQRFPDAALLLWPMVCALLAFSIGLFTFRKYAPIMADYL